jgi:hypothetical protein
MVGVRQTADAAKARVNDTLNDARPRSRRRAESSTVGPPAVLALQRRAGNAAVSALMAGRMRFPGDRAVADIDGALRELRRDEPAADTVERGLKAAKAAGVPVDLEGVRPPASALAVTTTGFGPGSVPAKKPVPPPKKVPAVSPLGRAGAKKAASARKGGGGTNRAAGDTAGATTMPETSGLPADALLQPPVPPAQVRPDDDPAFTQVTGKIKTAGRQKRAHPPAAAKAKEAQDAALPPAGDIGSQAKAAKADTMDAQRKGSFDKKAFIAAVAAAIEAKSPKTLKEADNYKSSGKAGEVKAEVKGLVTQGKEGQTADIKAATEAAPDQSKAILKPVTPMGTEPPGQTVPIPAAGAVPKPAAAEQLNLAAGRHEANQEMAGADVSETQLAESNEPQFEQGLADKKAAAAHADTAPAEFRQQEAQVIQQGKADATAETGAGLAGMQGSRGAALAKLVADKGKTKTKDEAKRAEVTTKIEQIFNATEADVKRVLDGIDPKVEREFNEGEAAARSVFENYVTAKMSAYKKDRYGGWLGPFRWARDKIKGMPGKVNEFYVAGRELYLKQMDRTIARVADIVGTDLTAAKSRIAAGRTEIARYVKSLPRDLKRVGSEASKEIGDRFEQLESDVDSKQEALVDTLATKYAEARKGLDERIEELQAANRGLVDKAIGAIKAIINTIRELAAMLKNVLARVAGVVGEIIKHPVRFLSNLIDGVKGGILKFKDDFLGHLRRGLMSWLFGALAEGGIELPKSFDIKGIIGFLASIFGLTWANIRSRIVKQIGDKAMGAVEKGVEIFKIISGPEGVGGLWEMLLVKLGDIKEMIFEKVKDFVQDRIISAGITWLIGLLNPAAAFIKACKLIYDVVMFFVNNASRIAKFVDTILDSVADIVRGNIGGVVNKINDVLGQMVPIIIGFLASVIGLGGIGAKVREIVQKLQKPVNQALDFVIKTGLKLAAPIIRGIAGISGKVKAKVAAGKAWVRGKAEAGKAWVKGKVDADRKIIAETARKPRMEAANSPFTTGGFGHHAFVATGKPGTKTMVGSVPQPVDQFLTGVLAAMQANVVGPPAGRQRPRFPAAVQAQVTALAGQIRQLLITMDRPVSDRPGAPLDRSAAIATVSELLTNIVMLVGSGGGATTAQIEREQGRSVSFARYDISGPADRHSDALVSVSGEIPNVTPEDQIPAHQPGMNRFFQSLRVRGTRNLEPQNSPNPAHRFHDSETKLLEFLADRLTRSRQMPADTAPGALRFPEFRGWIHLNSDFVTCGSCAFVINQFRQTFPNVTLIAQSNERLTPAEERRQAATVASRLN